ncbi:modification methylase [groundwater metagenome]
MAYCIEVLEKPQNKIIDYSWNFEKADTKYYTHGIYKYPAMMVAPIVKRLMDEYATPGESIILDPFCGSGSVLVESVLHDCESYGIDINPLALLLAKVKTTPIDSELLIEEYRKFVEFKNKNIHNLEVPNFFNVDFWFKPDVIKKLSVIKKWISEIEDEEVRNFFKVVFAETVRRASNTKNDEFKLVRLPEKRLATHNPDVYITFEKIFNHNVLKMEKFFRGCPQNRKKPHILDEDSRNKTSVPSNIIDLIITSPPYGDSKTTVAYGQFSRLSLQWLGFNKIATSIDKISLGGEVSKNNETKPHSRFLETVINQITKVDEKRAREVLAFYIDLDKCFKEMDRVTHKGSVVCFVVGNRTVKGISIPTDEIISELFSYHNFKHEKTIIRKIPNKVMPSLNSPTNEQGKLSPTMTKENIVILRKC